MLATALALPLSIATALAAESPMASDHKIACSEVKYSSEFLSKYPHAPAACIEAVEKEGKRYAKFQARVFLNSPDRTTVELLNVKGDPLTTFSFKPAPDAGVIVDGKKTKFTDLKKGEKISFYISADRLDGFRAAGFDGGFLGRVAAHPVIGIQRHPQGSGATAPDPFSLSVAECSRGSSSGWSEQLRLYRACIGDVAAGKADVRPKGVRGSATAV